ncbi:uncharacterized protein LOC120002472 [Tripterygium wilfordii]|uniref:uncharacterized protein LOC120002472 n=1 Tax=Tripterygium wilfordii TaxID=458696 RepID=UPI0018F81944|nr:uncharacterized protein LOC120002472 [Tripterygium wilfordii]
MCIKFFGVIFMGASKYTSFFTLEQQSLIDWIQNTGHSLGYIIVIKRSETSLIGKSPRLLFQCDCGGTYRSKKTSTNVTGTKKIDCPFRLKWVKMRAGDDWMVCGTHNHALATYMEGHPYPGQLSESETQLMVHLSMKNVKPRDILTSLKKQNPNVSTIKTVYNALQKFQTSEEAGSLERWRAFPHVLLMDATYKTNRYKMPLLEIVGVTATNMTFCIAFVFLHSEKVFNYTWALRCLQSTMAECTGPRVIITDKESSITDNESWNAFYKMWTKLLESETENAYVCNLTDLEVVFQNFPGVINYLKDVWLTPYKEMFVSAWTDKYLHFENQTTNRVESQHAKLKRYLESSQSDLVTSLSFIHHVIQSQDIAIKASIEQSKTIVQHRFNIPHFQKLCGFVSIHALHLILKEFERSKNAGEVSYKCGCQIRTSYGLPCAHVQAIYLKDGRPIPINFIDNFWRKLGLSPCVSLQEDDIDCVVDLQTNTRGRLCSKKKVASNTRANPSALLFVESDSPHSREPCRHSYSFGGPDLKSREDISTRANTTTFEFVEPDIFQFQEPARHSCSSTYNYSVHAYVRQFPPILNPYIMHVQDVKPDGNYGFRAIAVCLGLHEDAWATIRYNLIEELHIFRTQYVAIFDSDGQWTRVTHEMEHGSCESSFVGRLKVYDTYFKEE